MLFYSLKSFAPGDTKWRPAKPLLLRMCTGNQFSLHLPTQEKIVFRGGSRKREMAGWWWERSIGQRPLEIFYGECILHLASDITTSIYEKHTESVFDSLEHKRFVAWQYGIFCSVVDTVQLWWSVDRPFKLIDRNFYRKESVKFLVEMKKSSSNLSASTPSEIRSATKARLVYNKLC